VGDARSARLESVGRRQVDDGGAAGWERAGLLVGREYDS